MIRKILFTVMLIAAVMFAAGTAMADCTASWVSPADGSSYPVGTLVDLTGQAGASGSVGGTGLDLALVIDTSGSMGWSPDYTLNNYAKPAAIALVNALPADTTSVAVIGFNSSANTYQVLTALNPNKQDVIDAINSLIDGGGTNIGSGVAEATTTLLSGNTAGRAMMQVVLSDGFGSYNDEAETAYDVYGQVVHTVGVPGHDPDLMQEIATDGHGIPMLVI